MLLSIAYFAWGRMIIYDDNLSCRRLSQAKRKIYIFPLFFFERKTVATCFVRDLRRGFLNENHPEQFALLMHEAFWDLRITRVLYTYVHMHLYIFWGGRVCHCIRGGRVGVTVFGGGLVGVSPSHRWTSPPPPPPSSFDHPSMYSTISYVSFQQASRGRTAKYSTCFREVSRHSSIRQRSA
jgi:hypothetical protein